MEEDYKADIRQYKGKEREFLVTTKAKSGESDSVECERSKKDKDCPSEKWPSLRFGNFCSNI